LLAQSQTQAEAAGARPGCPELESKAPKGITPDGLVILNEANVDELSTLPGIGKSRATAIVELRNRLNGLKKVADLLRIKGIGWKSLAKLKEKVVLNRPAKAEPEEPAEPAQPVQPAESSKQSPGPAHAGSMVASMGGDPLH
jgi:competence protein ComEA